MTLFVSFNFIYHVHYCLGITEFIRTVHFNFVLLNIIKIYNMLKISKLNKI